MPGAAVVTRLLLAINAGPRCDRPKRRTRDIVKSSDPQADLLACIRHGYRYRFEVLKQLNGVGPAVYGVLAVVRHTAFMPDVLRRFPVQPREGLHDCGV